MNVFWRCEPPFTTCFSRRYQRRPLLRLISLLAMLGLPEASRAVGWPQLPHGAAPLHPTRSTPGSLQGGSTGLSGKCPHAQSGCPTRGPPSAAPARQLTDPLAPTLTLSTRVVSLTQAAAELAILIRGAEETYARQLAALPAELATRYTLTTLTLTLALAPTPTPALTPSLVLTLTLTLTQVHAALRGGDARGRPARRR